MESQSAAVMTQLDSDAVWSTDVPSNDHTLSRRREITTRYDLNDSNLPGNA